MRLRHLCPAPTRLSTLTPNESAKERTLAEGGTLGCDAAAGAGPATTGGATGVCAGATFAAQETCISLLSGCFWDHSLRRSAVDNEYFSTCERSRPRVTSSHIKWWLANITWSCHVLWCHRRERLRILRSFVRRRRRRGCFRSFHGLFASGAPHLRQHGPALSKNRFTW